MNCIISRLAICHIKPLARELGKILHSLCDEKDKNSNLEAQFVLLHEQNCIPLPTLCSICKGGVCGAGGGEKGGRGSFEANLIMSLRKR